jgi:hypothetical protein
MKARRIYELTKDEEFIISYALFSRIKELENEIKNSTDEESIKRKENSIKKTRELYDQFS